MKIIKEALLSNMKDAGCGSDTIEVCLACLDEGRINEILKRLDLHRNQLLENIHKKEEQISCLDYLIYRIENSENPERMSHK